MWAECFQCVEHVNYSKQHETKTALLWLLKMYANCSRLIDIIAVVGCSSSGSTKRIKRIINNSESERRWVHFWLCYGISLTAVFPISFGYSFYGIQMLIRVSIWFVHLCECVKGKQFLDLIWYKSINYYYDCNYYSALLSFFSLSTPKYFSQVSFRFSPSNANSFAFDLLSLCARVCVRFSHQLPRFTIFSFCQKPKLFAFFFSLSNRLRKVDDANVSIGIFLQFRSYCNVNDHHRLLKSAKQAATRRTQK